MYAYARHGGTVAPPEPVTVPNLSPSARLRQTVATVARPNPSAARWRTRDNLKRFEFTPLRVSRRVCYTSRVARSKGSEKPERITTRNAG